MFSLWTVISFSFSSSLMIFSLCIMGLETCICGFIFLSCVVYPSFFVWCGVVVDVVLDVFPPVCFCPWFLVPSFCTLPLTPLSSVCLSVFVMWPPLPSRPSQKTRTPPVEQTQVCPFFCFAFLVFLHSVSQLLSVCRTLVQEQFTQNWKLIYHLENLGLAND